MKQKHSRSINKNIASDVTVIARYRTYSLTYSRSGWTHSVVRQIDQFSSGSRGLAARVASLNGDVEGLPVLLYTSVGFIHQNIDSVVRRVLDDIAHPFLYQYDDNVVILR